jgi:hypothetical protein
MSLNVAPSTRPFPVGTKPGLLVDALQATASLFQYTAPAESAALAHRLWLLGIICAGLLARVWSLGAVGLHGDEETMGMAVRGILEHGVPLLPSDMLYPRGMSQLYLMAASVALFGESEWTLRLPSALCGVLLIAAAYWAGRRFLRPHWNIAFTASVAFLPALIDYSQTARMYIFLVTLVMTSMACLFEWERTGRVRWLIAATVALIWGLDMHVLAVATVLMLLMPGLLQGDGRKLASGGLAAATVVLAYITIEVWLGRNYPTPPSDFAANLASPPPRHSLAVRDFAVAFDAALWAAGAAVALLAWRVSRFVAKGGAAICATGLLFAGIALQVALYYHLAAIFYLSGAVVAVRYGSAQVASRLSALLIAVAALAAVHVALLAAASGTFVRLVGSLIGQPSVWPYVRIAELSPVAAVLVALSLALGAYRFAHRQQAADYWLLAVLGVWAPVFALGLFAWNVAPRYTAMSLAPLLLCAFATAQHAADWIAARAPSAGGRMRWTAIAAAAGALCVINPARALTTIASGYGLHPDHKGAAEFIRKQGVGENDVVLAEDVLQQTYYLGRVDYWLIGPQVARRFVKRTDQGVVDFYTGTPVVVTPEMLDKVIQQHPGQRIFVIGSGEDWRNGRRRVREDLEPIIESDRFTTVYLGRDGRTRVLQAVAAAPMMAPKSDEAVDAELTQDAETALEDAESGPAPAALRPPALE